MSQNPLLDDKDEFYSSVEFGPPGVGKGDFLRRMCSNVVEMKMSAGIEPADVFGLPSVPHEGVQDVE